MKTKPDPLFNKKIILFLVSQNISLFGSSVVGFAIILYITLATSSGLWLMLATLCSMLPQVLVSLWGGVWADRYNRKYLIMLSDTFIAILTLVLAIAFWSGYQRMELLLVVSAVRSIGSGIQTPAINAIFPQLVPQENLAKIQGFNQTLIAALLLLAPAVGGMVLGYLDIAWVFMLDVITAALAILIISFIKVEKIERTDAQVSILDELKEGIEYTFHHPLLRGIMICFACSFFLITPAAILTPLMVERSFGSEVWKLTANEMVWTIGSLVGGIAVSLYGNLKDKIKTVSLCLVAFGVTFALLGMVKNFIYYLLIMGVSGFFMPIIATAQTVLIQEITPPTMLGRVFSILQIITGSAMPIAILLFGPLADFMSIEAILVISGTFLTCVGVLYQISNQRQIKKSYS